MARARSFLVAKPRGWGDAGRPAAFGVVCPGLGQVELAVNQGVTSGGGVGGEDADLAVLGAAGGAGVLALHAGGGDALLDKSGVVDDQDAVGGAEMFGDVCLHVIADLVGLPAALGPEVLQSVRGGVADKLGELPGVLAAHRSQQAADVVPHPPARLDAGEAVPDPQEEFFQSLFPRAGGYVIAHTWKLSARLSQHAARSHVRGTGWPNSPRLGHHLTTLPTLRPLTSGNGEVRLEY